MTATHEQTLCLLSLVRPSVPGEALCIRHGKLVRDLALAHRGGSLSPARRRPDETASVCLVFDDASEAVRVALAYQAVLADLADESSVALAGAAVLHGGPGAADEIEQLLGLAVAGQTLLTAPVHARLEGVDFTGTRAQRHGHYRVSGVGEPVEVYEIGREGSAPLSPPQDETGRYRVLPAGDRWQPIGEVPNNLPRSVSRFVGRDSELSALSKLFDGGAALVTVLGPAGTGKTQLALEYASGWRGDFPGGTWFCDVSEARTVEGVCQVVGGALGVGLRGDAVNGVAQALAQRPRTLVVVDGAERVVDLAAETIGRWMARAPEAAFLATSRELLRIGGERTLLVEPLPVPSSRATTLAAIAGAASVELFVERARTYQPGFELTDENAADVAKLVRLLDGLPLAIELAAARVRVLSPAHILSRMARRFDLLKGGRRDVSGRQSTLRAALDWSWEMLQPEERLALAQCSVFQGGFSLEAAEKVLDLSAFPDDPWAMDVVQALVDKSLLRSWEPDGMPGEPRFGMLVTISEYVAEQLARPGAIRSPDGEDLCGPGAVLAAEQRHGQWFARLAPGDFSVRSIHAGQGKRLRQVGLDLENLVVACGKAMDRGEFDLAVRLYIPAWQLLRMRGPGKVLVDLSDRLLASPELGGRERVVVGWLRGWGTMQLGVPGTVADLEGVLAEAEPLEDATLEAGIHYVLGMTHLFRSQPEDAGRHFGAAQDLAAKNNDEYAEGLALNGLGELHRMQGRSEEARDCYERALMLARRQRVPRKEAVELANLAELHRDWGHADQAKRTFESALAILRDIDDHRLHGAVLAAYGELTLELGHTDSALQACTDAIPLLQASGDQRQEGVALGQLALARHRSGDTAGARQSLARGDALLRRCEDSYELAILQCIRVEVEHADGRTPAARSALQEAHALSTSFEQNPRSRISRSIARANELLGGELLGGEA